MIKSKEEVLALLVELGSSADEIAAKLQSLGIRGNKGNCRSCPIAQYLVANGVEVGFGVGVGVGVGVAAGSYYYSISYYPQLLGVHSFILGFDRGEYPKCELRI